MNTTQITLGVVLAGTALVLVGCASETRSGTPDPTTSTGSSQDSPLDGTWATTWTFEGLLAALGGEEAYSGVQRDAENNAGTIHLVFDRGRYDAVYPETGDSCPGSYRLEGDRIVMTATSDPTDWDCGGGLGELTADAEWTVDGDRLTLTDWKLSTEPGVDWFNSALWGGQPFERVE